MAEYSEGYSITVAPLAVKDKIIVGISGGEYGIRGFLDAYDAATGKRAWRFYTIPGPGEPGNETWSGDSWKQGGATDLDHRFLRSGTGPHLLGHGESCARLERRRSVGGQPVRFFGRGRGSRYRKVALVFPVHSP